MPDPENLSGAEEFLTAEIQLAETSIEAERTTHQTLDAIPGVRNITISHAIVTILYDSTFTAEHTLVDALQAAGLKVKHSETHRESPIAEIEDQVQPYLEHGPDMDLRK